MSESRMAERFAGAPAPADAPGAEPPLREVLVELWQNTEKLVRQEAALARAELDSKAQRLKRELSAAALGAGLLLCGALALLATVILLLDLIMPAWVASLVTGGAASGAGFALLKAKKRSAKDVIPQRTIQNLENDLRTFRESTK